MNLMDKLQKKFGKYAVYDLQKYLIIAYCFGLVTNVIGIPITGYLEFSMDAIFHGQIWRLVTWVLCADSGSLITLLFLYCVNNMARSFEQLVGTFRMNVYLVGGMLLNLVSAVVVYFLTWGLLGTGISVNLSNYDLLFTIFMALALCMPEATVYLSFLFPIKMKWMFVVYLALSGYQLYGFFSYGNALGGLAVGLLALVVHGSQTLVSLLNLFLFFHFSKIRLTKKQKKTQTEFRRQMASTPKAGAVGTRHKCAICGRTEKDDPNISFRYCSKCSGNKEYCQDHLFTHTHN